MSIYGDELEKVRDKCQIYLDEIVKNPAYFSDVKERCINLARTEGVPLSKESIKMKFQNIRALCDVYGIHHVSPFTPLTSFSQQNEMAFKEIFCEFLQKKN